MSKYQKYHNKLQHNNTIHS